MKKLHLLYIASAFLLSGLTSCEDMLTEKPDSAYEKDEYFDSESKAEMAVYGIYSSLSDANHYGSHEMATPASDDMYYTSRTTSDGQVHDIAHYNATSTNKWLEELWTLKYQGIDRANLAIDGICNMPGYAENTNLKRLVAEARFLRAFLAFDLVKYWGDVPFKTSYSSDYESAFQGRVSRETIYDEITSDLDFAKENLEKATTPERANQGAARALLMRVYLQRAGYSLQQDGKLTRPDDTLRKTYFQAVVNEWKEFEKTGHDFYPGSYEDFFKTFSAGKLKMDESLFEIAFFHTQGQRSGGWWGTYNGPAVDEPSGIEPSEASKYMGRANAYFRVVPEWKDFFEETDSRRDVNIVTYKYTWDAKNKVHTPSKTLKTNSWYPGKWRREWMPIGFKNPNSTDVNYCVLRFADAMLMAAEAYNELGGENTAQAWFLLNMVRHRAGATEITSANYAALLKAPKVYDLPFIADADEQGRFRTVLYWERGFELCYEGQRKYDLIRWGVLKEALALFGSKSVVNKATNQPYPAYKNFVSGKHELFPIPLSEMQSNPKLEGKNNPGY